ncbi:hypothetical protein TNCV_4825811 [Trichonephila clavipes]|uniref:Uncharacterized protein n=1 Tax=Trichonephila clavipes TaxID=2585209 RepID=A0A8X6UWM1_TRICX|nr:hypothetical protein TNCV_4825811 [Trichonephila clavipes]
MESDTGHVVFYRSERMEPALSSRAGALTATARQGENPESVLLFSTISIDSALTRSERHALRNSLSYAKTLIKYSLFVPRRGSKNYTRGKTVRAEEVFRRIFSDLSPLGLSMEGGGTPYSSSMAPSGSYILIVVSQPVTDEHKQLILERLNKGLESLSRRSFVKDELEMGDTELHFGAIFGHGSSPVPLKTRRVGQRCTLNLSRAETSSRWCGVVVRRGGASSGVVHVT